MDHHCWYVCDTGCGHYYSLLSRGQQCRTKESIGHDTIPIVSCIRHFCMIRQLHVDFFFFFFFFFCEIGIRNRCIALDDKQTGWC
ncbi:hypothetical protein K449DRAFT_252477 [Hypoxylon sp. EC38]|nr:hypothetical protein K449DRAFT_252477 [Hypoxylon sp. EC38]